MLLVGIRILRFHVDEGSTFSFSQPIGEVTKLGDGSGAPGLKNLSTSKWTVTSKSGQLKEVIPGSTLKLIDGLRINFGLKAGEIRL